MDSKGTDQKKSDGPCATGAIDLRGTWLQALFSFFIPILLVLSVRWLLFEPFTIPSGSMIPNLLIHDYIFVNKLAYGVRWPFSKSWIVNWGAPQRGDVVVFRYPQNEAQFFIKRVIGLPGETVIVQNGEISINGASLSQAPAGPSRESTEAVDLDSPYETLTENNGKIEYTVQYHQGSRHNLDYEEVIPPGHYFMMGDNRDESSDSRVWGFVPVENLMGKAEFIWLSCEQTLATSEMLCDPKTLRFSRIFRKIK
ncbi:MAG: signal peptidase I [Pseudobdellovibrionaceae bacterium]